MAPKSNIDWVKMLKLVPADQKSNFYAFKAKNDAYFRRMMANPPEPPKINWEEYKKIVPIPGLVDNLMNSYNAFKVPVPEDKYTAEVDKQWTSLEPEIKSFCAEMDDEIKKANAEIDKINAEPAFDEITMEMYYDIAPNEALDPVKRPSFWPHLADEQLGWVDPTVKAEGKGGH